MSFMVLVFIKMNNGTSFEVIRVEIILSKMGQKYVTNHTQN